MPRPISTLSFKKKSKIRQQLSIDEANSICAPKNENLHVQLPEKETNISKSEVIDESHEVSVTESNVTQEPHEITINEVVVEPKDNNQVQTSETAGNSLKSSRTSSTSSGSSKFSSLTSESNSLTLSNDSTYYMLYSDENWKNFWDIHGYDPVLKRCRDGNHLGSNLKECLHQRAAIEQKYYESILDWRKHWIKKVRSDDFVEYGGCKEAWCELLEAEEKITRKHSELSLKYERFSSDISDWLNQNYEKHVIHFNQEKLFREDFKLAQKDWRKTLEKYDKFKKEYESLCKMYEKEAKDEIKCKKDISKKICNEQVQLLNFYEPQYKKSMTDAFELTQRLERLRKKEFKKAFNSWLSCIKDQLSADTILDTYQTQKYNVENDLLWYSNNYGPGMKFVMPI